MTPFPHHYRVSFTAGQLLAPPRAPIAAGAPPQFGGDEHVWSPEELLAGAALACLWTTFQALARRDKLEVAAWDGQALAVLDRGLPVPVFTAITLTVAIRVAAGEEDRARALIAKAERQCIVSFALKTPVAIDVTVTPA